MWRWCPSCHAFSANTEMLLYICGRCLKPVFDTMNEVLFCVPTRSVLIAVFAQMMLQAEVPGLDDEKLGDVVCVWGRRGLVLQRTELFWVLCLSSNTETRSCLPNRHALCLSTRWRAVGFLLEMLVIQTGEKKKLKGSLLHSCRSYKWFFLQL